MNAIAHMDDSGSEPESPVCVVAGFVATVPVWDNFSKRWDNVLRDQRVLVQREVESERSLLASISPFRRPPFGRHRPIWWVVGKALC